LAAKLPKAKKSRIVEYMDNVSKGHVKKQNKKFYAEELIQKKIIEKGTAFKQEIFDELTEIPRRTLETSLDRLLKKSVFIKLKDGKIGWIGRKPDEDIITKAYKELKLKFCGEPPLSAINRKIKEPPDKTKELLLTYTDYHIPNEEEMKRSAIEIQRNAIYGGWYHSKLNERHFKNWAVKKGIIELQYSGLNKELFLDLIKNEPNTSLNDILEYSKKFPDLLVRMEEEIKGNVAYYKFIWEDDFKETYKKLSSDTSFPWVGEGKFLFPKKMDKKEYTEYRSLVNTDPETAFIKIIRFAGSSVPDDTILTDCINWLSNIKLRRYSGKIFQIIKLLIVNGKDCETLTLKQEKIIVSYIADIAFSALDIPYQRRYSTFEILSHIDKKLLKDNAINYCFHVLGKMESDQDDVTFVYDIASMLFKDSEIKSEMKIRAEKELIENRNSNENKVIRLFMEKFYSE